MVTPKLRSRSLRRVFRKVPGGSTKIHYKKKKPNAAKCSRCGDILKGISRGLHYQTKSMAKSKKRPERPYGGVLCSRCTRKLIVDRVRG